MGLVVPLMVHPMHTYHQVEVWALKVLNLVIKVHQAKSHLATMVHHSSVVQMLEQDRSKDFPVDQAILEYLPVDQPMPISHPDLEIVRGP
jgi:hypothetical protein